MKSFEKDDYLLGNYTHTFYTLLTVALNCTKTRKRSAKEHNIRTKL